MITMTHPRWPAQIRGPQVSLQAVQAEAIAADWLEEAAQAIAGRAAPCPLQARLDEGDAVFWIHPLEQDSGAVGALSGRLADADGSRILIWTWLAIDAHWRHYGYGGASIPLFEDAARELGAVSAHVPLPSDNGVALYFWLRLGYVPDRAPVLPRDLPAGVAADAIWMRRSLLKPERE